MRIENSLQDKIAARRQRRARKNLEEKELEAIKGEKKDKRHKDKKHRKHKEKKHRDKGRKNDKHEGEEKNNGEEENMTIDDAEEWLLYQMFILILWQKDKIFINL